MKPNRYLWFLAVVCFALAGCSQPLRTLMALDSEQKEQKNYVEAQTRKFNLLLKEAKKGALKGGLSRQDILIRFGEPTLVKDHVGKPAVITEGQEGDVRTTLLYRKPAAFIGAPKVYLDFDKNDTLLAVRVEEPRAE